MVPKIGLSCDSFAITDALAVHILRSTTFFENSSIELISMPEEAEQCVATVGFGQANMEMNCFSNDIREDGYTLEKLAGLDGYATKLSSAGQVYAKFAHQLIQQQRNERGLNSGKVAVTRDFRKLYEYMIEVVDSWHWDIPLQYPMPEKIQLLAFLDELQNKVDMELADQQQTDFLTFAEQCISEIGRKFDKISSWYMDYYLPAFEFIIGALKQANDFGVLFLDFNFSRVTLEDLLKRAGNNFRLPRLIVRPSFNKFRIDCVRMVKPILYFPHEWVGRSDHLVEALNIEQIDYVSNDRSFAIAQTLEAAAKLAYRLLTYAEESSNIVTAQDCYLNFIMEGQNMLQSARSLPDSRHNSISNDHSEAEQDCYNNEKERAAMDLKILAGIETICIEETEMDGGETMKITTSSNVGPTNCAEDREDSSMLLLDLDECSSVPSDTSEERHEEESRRMGVAGTNKTTCNRETQKVLSSSTSWNSFPTNSAGINHPMDNGANPHIQQNRTGVEQSLHSTLNGNFTNNDRTAEVESIVQKVFSTKCTVLEVPDSSFTISHVLGAAFIGLALGTANQNLQIRILTEPRRFGCSIRLGPGIYDYDDGDHKFNNSHMVSLFSLDLCSDVMDKRLTIAGLSYAFYAKKAIARIASNGSPEGLSILLKKGSARRKLTLIFRRVYHRLVLPIDEWVSNSHNGTQHTQQTIPPSTREAAILQTSLSGLIEVAANDAKKGQQNGTDKQKIGIHLSSGERLVAFRIALHICIQFINDLVRSLLLDE